MIRRPQQQIEQAIQDGYHPGWNTKRPAEMQEIEIADEPNRKFNKKGTRTWQK